MIDKIYFAKWFSGKLTDKTNPFSSSYAFEESEDVIKFFKARDFESLSWNIYFQGTKKESSEIDKCFKTLNLDFDKLAFSAINEFKDKIVTSEFVEMIAALYVRGNTNSEVLLQLLNQASFKYAEGSRFDNLSLSLHRDKDIAINKFFGSKIINTVKLNVVKELLYFRNEEIIQFHFESILERLFKEAKYIFAKDHVEILLEQSICLRNNIVSNSFDKTPDISINNFINGLLMMNQEGEINAQTIKDLLIDKRSGYSELLRYYPSLSQCKQIQAAYSLEQLTIKNAIANLNQLYHFDNFNSTEPPKASPINNFKDIYPEQDWVPILSHVASYIAGNSSFSKDAAINICEKVIDTDTPYQDLFIDILDSIKYMNNELNLSQIRCKGLGFAFMLHQIKLPILPVFEYAVAESDNWYDGYETILYDHLAPTPQNSITEMNSKKIELFLEILQAASNAGAHFVVLSQAIKIQEMLKSWFNHPRITDIFMSSLSKVDLHELASFSPELQKSIFFLALKNNVEVATSILPHITIKPISRTNTTESSEIELFKNAVLNNVNTLNNVLNSSIEDLPTEILILQTNVIGRVKRDITYGDGVLAILHMLAIKQCLLGFRAIVLDTPSEDLFNASETEDYYYGHRSLERTFMYSHFPRLKNHEAIYKINALVKYLKATGLLSKILTEEYAEEGRYQDRDTLYVFGEFSWINLIRKLDNSVKKIKFLYVLFTEEDEAKINEVELTLCEEFPSLIAFLFESYAKNEALIFDAYSSHIPYDGLKNCKNHYLPEVEFQGVNLKE